MPEGPTVAATNFVATLAANVDNERMTDTQFREFVRNTIPIVIYPRPQSSITDESKINALWETWQRSDKVERFGQFALNRLNLSGPMPEIYYETDSRRARERLSSVWPALAPLN